MPFIPFVRVSNVDRAIALAKESEQGFGHTAMLHSRDTSVMSRQEAVDAVLKLLTTGGWLVRQDEKAEVGGARGAALPQGGGVAGPVLRVGSFGPSVRRL